MNIFQRAKDVIAHVGNGLRLSEPSARDETLDEYDRLLLELLESIKGLRARLVVYADSVLAMTRAAGEVGTSVKQFYKPCESRQESVKLFTTAQREMGEKSKHVFSRNFVREVLKSCDDWMRDVQKVQQHTDKTRQAKSQMRRLDQQVKDLEAQKARRETKGGSLSPKEQETLDNMCKKLARYETALKNMCSILQKNVLALVEGRFERFDKIFVRIMEYQMEFFNLSSVLAESYRTGVEHYRSLFPADEDDEDRDYLEAHEADSSPSPESPADSRRSSTRKSGSRKNGPPLPPRQERSSSAMDGSQSGLNSGQQQAQKHRRPKSSAPQHTAGKSKSQPKRPSAAAAAAEDLDLLSGEAAAAAASAPAPQSRGAAEDGFEALSSFGDASSKPSPGAAETVQPPKSQSIDFLGFGEAQTLSAEESQPQPQQQQSQPQHQEPQRPVQTHRKAESSLDEFFGISDDASSPTNNVSPAVEDSPLNSGSFDFSLYADPNSGGGRTTPISQPVHPAAFDPFDPLQQQPVQPSPQQEEEDGESKSAASEAAPEDVWAGLEDTAAASASSSSSAAKNKEELQEIIAEKQSRAIQRLRAREAAQSQLAEEMREASHRLNDKLTDWEFKNGIQKNIRTLLSSLHLILWEGTNWEPVSLTDLMSFNNVKKRYHRAMNIVHPDKVKGQRHVTADMLVIAERAFEALNTSFNQFRDSEKNRV